MSTRSLVILAVALMLSSGVAAEPPKAPVGERPGQRPAVIELASAEAVRPTGLPQHLDAQPAKHPRAMRVTTCRCGDQPPKAEQQP